MVRSPTAGPALTSARMTRQPTGVADKAKSLRVRWRKSPFPAEANFGRVPVLRAQATSGSQTLTALCHEGSADLRIRPPAAGEQVRHRVLENTTDHRAMAAPDAAVLSPEPHRERQRRDSPGDAANGSREPSQLAPGAVRGPR